ncbi:uncharacterized protein LOC100574851 [Acyrthosiphon pisum]|uniref:Uncharacterized protein n=1 Tax=Acyrthosiphon pisum TaxID=7029 RepID=A0A8R2ADT5_ACYPI|nr:uncharacterized protein LOC100574851 [Acyrthosiphon pisum]|eukprot:XP_003244004.1 PREDICTED: uncharacterized protein LOC100574851 [Acyrthosiphon pisum]
MSSSSFMFAATRSECLCVVVASLLLLQTTCLQVAGAAVVPLAVVKAASQCSAAPDTVDCLMHAAAAGVDALARSADPVDLVPGCVTLVKNAASESDPAPQPSPSPAPPRTATDIDAASAPVGGESALVDSLTAFVKSRAISVRAPAHLLESLKSTLIEARGKKDKYAGPLLMGAMMVAGTLLPIKLGALAMMSGKALMTSMLALMLSAILALKKLASGGGSHSGTTYEVINVPSQGGHGPHGRSLRAHAMAYGPPPPAETPPTPTPSADGL